VVIGALFGWGLLGRPVMGLAIGLIAGVFGQVGDLFESAIKREVDVKDFGSIVPGHGGVLDRFDSLLIVAPMVWLLVWLHRGL
jgi:phosphatidate cytidylyltransferase